MFNTPGTITIGYNSMAFDDEFLRFSFFRNLLPPYRHQYDNGCSRMDVFPMVLIYWLFNRDDIRWPEIDGKPSLKLESLNAVNHLAQGRSHEAMTDVSATLALAGRLRRSPAVWDYLVGYFDKIVDGGRVASLPLFLGSAAGEHPLGLLVDGRFGVERRYMAPAIAIGNSIPYKNQTLWLRLDTPELKTTTADTIADTTWVIRKKSGEPPIVLPPRERYWKRLNPENAAVVPENRQWILDHSDLFGQIIRYHREYRYPKVPDLDLDASLYELGFMPPQEEQVCQRFHTADIPEKIRLIDRFHHDTTRVLALRLLWRNYPEALPGAILRKMAPFMRRVNPKTSEEAMVDYRGEKRLTPAVATERIGRLRAQGEITQDQSVFLSELEAYLAHQFNTEGFRHGPA